MVRWTKQARADLLAIGYYIASDKPGASRSWVAKLKACANDASHMPYAARVVPEYGRSNVREVFLRSYRIIFRVVDGGIHVLHVWHGHRLLPDLDLDACD